MISLNPVFFLRGYQYLLEALFFIKHHQKFKSALNQFEFIITQKSDFPRDDNIDGLIFYTYTQIKLIYIL